MDQPAAIPNWILLAGGGDDDSEFWRSQFDLLKSHRATRPDICSFIGLELSHGQDLEAAYEAIQQHSHHLPVLVVINAELRSRVQTGSTELPVISLIRRLQQLGSVPLIVKTENPPDAVLRSVIEHPNRLLWSDTPPAGETVDSALALALEDLAQPTSIRRLIISIAPSSSKFRIMFGSYTYTPQSVPHKALEGVVGLINDSEYKPHPSNEPEWLIKIQPVADRVFARMISEPLGTPITKLIQETHLRPRTPNNGLTWLDLRFEIEPDRFDGYTLFNLPFELIGTAHTDLLKKRHLCRHTPMARRLILDESPFIRKSEKNISDTNGANATKRLLFIGINARGDLTIKRENETKSTTIPALKHIATEKEYLLSLAERLKGRLVVEIAEVTRKRNKTLRAYLREKIYKGHYDIIHFAGHGDTVDGTAFLAFPDRDQQVKRFSMESVSDWISGGDCKLLVLSSCNGASEDSAKAAMEAGAAGMLAFRWPVDDEQCVTFIQHFYDAYFDEATSHSISEAYRCACERTYRDEPEKPTWASAMAVVRD